MKAGKIRTWAAGMACAFFSIAAASALTIDDDDPLVIGTIKNTENASVATEATYVNILLGLAPNAGPVTIPVLIGQTYERGDNVDPGSGVVTTIGAVKTDGGGNTGSGFEYVLAKYDGPNAGSVVFYFGGAAFTLPTDSSTIWLNEQQNGYGLSHWTGFNPMTGPGPGPGPGVPDAGSTLALLGLAVTGLGLLRRRLG